MKEKIYVYSFDEKLPKHGWIQRCNNCNTYTARTVFFKEDKNFEYLAHICPLCKKNNKDKTKKFQKISAYKIKNFDLK